MNDIQVVGLIIVIGGILALALLIRYFKRR